MGLLTSSEYEALIYRPEPRNEMRICLNSNQYIHYIVMLVSL